MKILTITITEVSEGEIFIETDFNAYDIINRNEADRTMGERTAIASLRAALALTEEDPMEGETESTIH